MLAEKKTGPRIPLSSSNTEASFGLLRTVTNDDHSQERSPTVAAESKAEVRPREVTFESSEPWNPSTKVKETFWEYMPNLPDFYPRDEFTKLPKPPIKRKPPRPKSRDVAISRATSAGFSHITDDDITETFDSTKVDRPTVFKCHTVTDIPKRKPVDSNAMYRDESGLHLTANIKSWLFRNGLLPNLVPLWESTVANGDVVPPDNETAIGNSSKADSHPEPSWYCMW